MDSFVIAGFVIDLALGLLVSFAICALAAFVLSKIAKGDTNKYIRVAFFLALAISLITAGGNLQKNIQRTEAGGQQSVAGTNNPESGSIEARSLAYWASARPIVDRQISDFGRPYATFLADSRPGLLSGDRATWVRFIGETKRLRPALIQAIDDLSRLGVPSGRTYEWHEKQLRAWSRRSEGIDMIVADWTTEDFDLLERGFDVFEESQALGLDADRMQADLVSWLKS